MYKHAFIKKEENKKYYKMKKTILSVAALLLLAGNINATTVGYAKDGNVGRTSLFRLGSTTTQGQAIKLSHAKLQALKGKTIDFAEIAVGSRNTTGKKMHAFLTTSLGGTPIAEGDVDITDPLKRMKWTLNQPYTITGDEEALYIGYTVDIPTSYNVLVSDGTFDVQGCNFAYKDGEWVDTYGLNKGNAYITLNVDEAPSYADAIMGNTSFSGYYKVGTDYDFTARFLNAGTAIITSFDAVVTIDGVATTQHFDGVNIAPRTNYSFKLNNLNSTEVGSKSVKVEIANVSGETDNSDNLIAGNVYFYPTNMERSILVEGFTSQECTGCPSGHVVLNNAIKTARDNGIGIVEASHHAGYYPDIFTMSEDAAYTFYYGTSTYAPAVMANRNADPAVSSIPVNEISAYNALELISHASLSRPYASLNLETKWDESTRQLKVKLDIDPHEDFPTDKMLFNVFLVQDGIQAYQSNGGANYTHDRVFRGTLTNNSWGIAIQNLKAGEMTTWEETVTIPEKIHSSFWTDDMIKNVNGKDMYYYESGSMRATCDIEQSNIEVVPANMSVIAYVAEYDNEDNTKNVVFNSCEAAFGGSYKQAAFGTTSGIENVEEKKNDASIYVENGKVRVMGDYDKMMVYSLSGTRLNADANLAKGTYIVKVISGGKQATKKIMIR